MPYVGPGGSTLLPPADGRPIYRRLLDQLRHQIEAGELKPGDLIPPELEIARRHRISRHTVRQAIVELAREGLLRRERGRGTFVQAQPLVQSLGSFYSFARQMETRGHPYYTRVLHRGTAPADAAVAERLRVAVGAPVLELELLRVTDETPLALDFSVTPYELVPALAEADVTKHSLYDVMLERHGVRIALGREELRPVVLDRRQAGLLGVAPGAPAFHVSREVLGTTADGQSRPVEWRRSVVRGDRFVYRVDLPVDPPT